MKIKVFALLCTVLFILTCFIGCGGNDVGNTSDVGGAEDVISTKVNNIKNISDYAIVRSADASERVKEAVKALDAAIREATSERLYTVVDTKKETQYEIQIGNTSRKSLDASKLENSQFVIKQIGDKIVITGGSDLAIEKGVQYFIEHYISKEKGVTVPGGEGVRTRDENVFSKIDIGGNNLKDYVISGILYDVDLKQVPSGSTSVMEAERLADFSAKIEQATYLTLPIVASENLSEHNGKYIMLDDTNSDFTSYEIKVEDGNIILYANYYSLDDCINSFFADFLGYDLKEEKITGSQAVSITEGRKYDVEKTAIYSKEKLYEVLEMAYNNDDMLIVGQHMNQTIPIGEVFDWDMNAFVEECGVEPALLGWDVVGTMIYPQNLKSLESARVKIAYQLTEFMRSGGIVTLSPHYPNPLDEEPVPGNSIKGDLGHEDKWEELFTEGTEINTRFMGYLEQLGDFFEILKQNGAPVIFRNLLESNGNWTWYCIGQTNASGVEKKIDPKYIKDLWILIYDYLVNEREINNLIWLYAPNVMARGGGAFVGDVMDCYPGNEYVDIVGVDWYPDEIGQKVPDTLLTSYEDLVKTGKIFVYGELSAGSNRTVGDNYTFTTEDYDEMLMRFTELGVKSAYTLAWSSWDTPEGRVKLTIYEMGMGDRFYYNNDTYLDKSETYELLYD
ncbi:MAG: hypothetical protein IKJ91_03490 [Clostridia bacterium]|nr:hypothetical protein [Clostridia bacterium]